MQLVVLQDIILSMELVLHAHQMLNIVHMELLHNVIMDIIYQIILVRLVEQVP